MTLMASTPATTVPTATTDDERPKFSILKQGYILMKAQGPNNLLSISLLNNVILICTSTVLQPCASQWRL